jgi:cyanophycinase
MGIITLAGGNEFRPNCVQMDRRLLERLGKPDPRVVVIPTAAVRGNPRLAGENGARHFTGLGAQASAAMVVTRREANTPRLFDALLDADMVAIAGGDPGYLLETLRDSLLWRAIMGVYERGGMIVGSSAGAMLLSAYMRAWNTGDWMTGLGVASRVAVLVHHNGINAATADQSRQTPAGLPILGIAEATACFSDNDDIWEVAGVGSVTVYRHGEAARFTHGTHFRLES